MVDVDAAPSFIHLPDAYDVRRQAWDVVDACQGALFSVLAREHDGAAPLDGNGGSVPEEDRTTNPFVELGEEGSGARHVVGSSGVEDPAAVVAILRSI